MRVGLIGLLCTISLIVFAAYTKMRDDIRSRMPELERLVAEQRLRQTDKTPVRMVVYDEDHSGWVTTNVFEQVIYDETDQIDNDADVIGPHEVVRFEC